MSADQTTIGMAHPTVVPGNADTASADGSEESPVDEASADRSASEA